MTRASLISTGLWLFITLSLMIFVAGSQDLIAGCHQRLKLQPNDGAAHDGFGYAVAVSGTTGIVGEPYDDDNGPGSGSAYVFDLTTGTQIAKLLPSDGAAGDVFGMAVAISGTTALIGAPRKDDLANYGGAAYLFDLTTGTQTAKLLPSVGQVFAFFDNFLAISGNTVIVSAYNEDTDVGRMSGAAYFFDATTGTETRRLLPSDGDTNEIFGNAVAISGTTAIIGSEGDDDNGTDTGAAYLFDISTGGQIAKLLPPDGMTADNFGCSVAIHDSTVIIGADFDRDLYIRSGSAYLFDAVSGL